MYLLNAPICHTPGLRYVTSRIDRNTAQRLVREIHDNTGRIVSAIGHDGTAQVLSLVLDQDVPVNRISMQYAAGDRVIALQLRQRQPEGVVLTAEMVEEIGYDLTLIETAPAPVCVIFGSAAVAGALDSALVGDIDVAYGGMDQHEARALAIEWSERTGLRRSFGPLQLDMHPEIVSPQAPSYHEGPSGERVNTPAHYRVLVPHPSGTESPPVVVLAGDPTVKSHTVNNFASMMRALGHMSDPLEAGKALAGWVANNRDGLRIDMTIGTRIGDAEYKEGTLEGIRAGWRKLCPPFNGHRRDLILGHIDGYVAGLGTLLGALLDQIPPRVIAEIAERSDRAVGELAVRRKEGPVWQVCVGDLTMTLTQAAEWLSTGKATSAAA